jgi:hypothetical protein
LPTNFNLQTRKIDLTLKKDDEDAVENPDTR